MTNANSQNETFLQPTRISNAPHDTNQTVNAETKAANESCVVGGEEFDEFFDDMEYVTDEVNREQNHHKLDVMFDSVKDAAQSLKQHETNATNYEHHFVAKSAEFAIEALKDATYLDKYYKGVNANNKKFRYKKVVDYGYNFGPLLNQSWYDKGKLPLNKANRWSRAMNTLIKMYNADVSMQVDTVNRFLEIIRSKGGLGKLVSYKNSSAKDDAENEVGDTKMDVNLTKAKGFAKSNAQITELAKKGLSHFTNKTGLPSIQINQQVPVNTDSLSLWIVKKNTNQGFELISATDKSNEIQKLVAKCYASDFALLEPHVRVLAETVATQCIPSSHQNIYTKLLEQAEKHSGGADKLAVRRVIYKENTGEFVMSAIRINSSVVTIATPKTPVFDNVEHDLFLVTSSRRKFETEIVSKRNFASHTVSINDAKPPMAINSSGGVAINMDEIGNTMGTFKLLFMPESTETESLYQVDIDRNQLTTNLWSCEVSRDWLKVFRDTFTSQWLESHGKHMNRAHQEVIEVKFQKSFLEVGFYKEGTTFANHLQIQTFENALGTKAYKSCFLSKDFAIAMQALGDLNVTSKPMLKLHDGCLSVCYETDVAKYELFIPRCDANGNRSVTGFKTYALSPFAEDPDLFELEYTQEEIAEEFK